MTPEKYLEQILFDPTVGKIVAVAVGITVIVTVVKILKRTLARHMKETTARNRARKFLTFLSHLAILLYLSLVFHDSLGDLTVAFGVAGAGIAFALQEVIASFAGWIAISFGGFYNTGDRVQMGGIKGGVIDIGVLRTTLMKVGDWVGVISTMVGLCVLPTALCSRSLFSITPGIFPFCGMRSSFL